VITGDWSDSPWVLIGGSEGPLTGATPERRRGVENGTCPGDLHTQALSTRVRVHPAAA